jgi:hypothetical protein
MGNWPPRTEEAVGYSIRLGRSKRLSRKHDIIDLTVVDLPGWPTREGRECDVISEPNFVLEKSLPGSDVLIFFLDASRVKSVRNLKAGNVRATYDSMMADCIKRSLGFVAKTSLSRSPDHGAHVMTVFSKFDLINEGFILRTGLKSPPPSIFDQKGRFDKEALASRRRYGQRILHSHLPATKTAIIEAGKEFPEVTWGAYFFCGLETDTDRHGRRVPKIRPVNSLLSLAYARDEYSGVLEYLWTVGVSVPNAVKTE